MGKACDVKAARTVTRFVHFGHRGLDGGLVIAAVVVFRSGVHCSPWTNQQIGKLRILPFTSMRVRSFGVMSLGFTPDEKEAIDNRSIDQSINQVFSH